jgi:hypothetical protein
MIPPHLPLEGRPQMKRKRRPHLIVTSFAGRICGGAGCRFSLVSAQNELVRDLPASSQVSAQTEKPLNSIKISMGVERALTPLQCPALQDDPAFGLVVMALDTHRGTGATSGYTANAMQIFTTSSDTT